MKTETVELVRIPEIETGDLEWEGLGIVEKAQQIPAIIPDDQTYEQCGLLIVEAGKLKKKITERFEKEKTRRHEAHKMVCDLENAFAAFPAKAVQIAEPKWVAYRREDERKRKEKEALAQEAAKRIEEEKILADAAVAEAYGEPELAEAIASQPVEPIPVIIPGLPKTTGLSAREYWIVVVTNKKALIDFVAANPQYGAFLSVNEAALKKYAKSTEGEVKIPGVLFDDREKPVNRGR